MRKENNDAFDNFFKALLRLEDVYLDNFGCSNASFMSF